MLFDILILRKGTIVSVCRYWQYDSPSYINAEYIYSNKSPLSAPFLRYAYSGDILSYTNVFTIFINYNECQTKRQHIGKGLQQTDPRFTIHSGKYIYKLNIEDALSCNGYS